MKHIIQDRHIGIIEINVGTIVFEPWLVRCILSRGIVINAELQLHSDKIRYTMICDEFFGVPDGGLFRHYDVIIDDETGIRFE